MVPSMPADYTLSCAFRQLALDAKTGAYKSPFYGYVNQWQPSAPANGGTWAWTFHTWDYVAAFENWPKPTNPQSAFPGKTDIALSRFLQNAWGQLIHNGTIDPSKTQGWASAEKVAGFPLHSGVMLISSPDLPPY